MLLSYPGMPVARRPIGDMRVSSVEYVFLGHGRTLERPRNWSGDQVYASPFAITLCRRTSGSACTDGGPPEARTLVERRVVEWRCGAPAGRDRGGGRSSAGR